MICIDTSEQQISYQKSRLCMTAGYLLTTLILVVVSPSVLSVRLMEEVSAKRLHCSTLHLFRDHPGLFRILHVLIFLKEHTLDSYV